ncbi:alpha-L-arabinofuranosidase [Enterococcus xinjiangensis]|uniref:alpha-N-arabinofuranosidase n=1 Tax=Enterococcus lactis TaxID=357441 RepID=UPI00192B58DE|nr:alpha-L-arabinofuranosidase C-terminal domain-containing protein [Enterococcus lactis]MBL4993698.1 alpha-L-arabinofuranosidase [Enterococcus lactis]MBL4999276.1 alpha-L-arabinofuranosidase [Enterococcus lactis]
MEATMLISSVKRVGKVDPRLYSSFIEHMGRAVYEGIYQPDHPSANESGFRQDVIHLVKELNIPMIRYPGGNFVSGFRWEDSIGPIASRPKRLDLAWRTIETNEVGIHEFYNWCQHVGAEINMAVNLGTRGVDAARNLVEYCNFPKGTFWSDLRIKNGQKKPFGVKLWCLGNELDGPWQVGAKSAYEYGRLANEASKVMKLVDDSIKTILVGSSTPRLPSYPEWDRIALEEAYENVDYLALHNYIDKYDEEDLTKPPKNERDDTATYLAKAYRFDRQIEEIVATCDYVKGYLRSEKTMYLAFDEWNVHAQPEKRHRDFEIGSPIDWCYFTMEDTLLFGSLGLAILRHADRVKISCQSLLVNTIPLILTDAKGQAWKNPTYYVMQHLSKYAKGQVLEQQIICPVYDCEKIKKVPYVDSVVVDNGNQLTIFLINRTNEQQNVMIEHNFNLLDQGEHYALTSSDLLDKNTREEPEKIKPEINYFSIEKHDELNVGIEKYSWNVIRIKKM